MGIESQGTVPSPGKLSPMQVKIFEKAEPKTLGAIQIVIGVLALCLSASVLQIYEIHFTADLIALLVIVLQLIASGSVLIHTGRVPSLFWVKTSLVMHLVSAAFTTAALGLLSQHLPYRQNSYHCEHCRKLEIYAVLLIDGLLGTLVLFLIVELLICITAILFGLRVLTKGGMQLPSMTVTQRAASPEAPPEMPSPVVAPPPVAPPQEAAPPQVVVVTVVEPEPIDDEQTPPTEPQVAPIESLDDIQP